MFDNLSNLTNVAPTPFANELMTYLQERREKVQDVIVWWQANWKTYPRLSQMALDYQCIPGMFDVYIIEIQLKFQPTSIIC